MGVKETNQQLKMRNVIPECFFSRLFFDLDGERSNYFLLHPVVR